uniref:Uncharacterized protein n=1 Tax=Anopheles coluzzii TaxID=1518534 RepID=A0A8W7PEQ2_ANOCL
MLSLAATATVGDDAYYLQVRQHAAQRSVAGRTVTVAVDRHQVLLHFFRVTLDTFVIVVWNETERVKVLVRDLAVFTSGQVVVERPVHDDAQFEQYLEQAYKQAQRADSRRMWRKK